MTTVTFLVTFNERLEEQPLFIPSALYERVESDGAEFAVDFTEDDRDATYTMPSSVADAFETILENSPAVHSFTFSVR